MRTLMRKACQPGVILLLVITMNHAALALPEHTKTQSVATVNTVDIKQHDLDSEILQLKMEMDFRNRSLPKDRIDALKSQLTETLIERELLYQKALERELQVRARWVARALDELKLRLKNHGMSMQDYLSAVGATESELRERVRRGLMVQRLLRREVLRQIKVGEREMQNFYQQHPDYFKGAEQVRARHILIEVPSNADDDTRNQALRKIQAIADQLAQGADFGVLALTYSQCPSKDRGGDLGYFTRDQMIQDFSDAAFRLRPGEISDIVTTRYGYHLIQVLDRKPPSQLAYRYVRDKIERTLRRNKEKAAANAYLAALKKKAIIKRHLP